MERQICRIYFCGRDNGEDEGGMVGNMASISGSYIPTDDGIVLNAKVHKRSAFRTDGIDKCDTEKMISEPRD